MAEAFRQYVQNAEEVERVQIRELAANLFRITQTEAKITAEQVRGQKSLENTARSVGQKVRRTMMEISGITPESIPAAEDVRSVKGNLKKSHKSLAALINRFE